MTSLATSSQITGGSVLLSVVMDSTTEEHGTQPAGNRNLLADG